MSRGLWFVAGAGAGIYGMVRGRRAAEALTAEGLHDRMTALFLGVRLFRDEVAQGAADRETELRERFAVVPDGRRELGVSMVAEERGVETGAARPPQPTSSRASRSTGSTSVASSTRDQEEGS